MNMQEKENTAAFLPETEAEIEGTFVVSFTEIIFTKRHHIFMLLLRFEKVSFARILNFLEGSRSSIKNFIRSGVLNFRHRVKLLSKGEKNNKNY